MHCGILWIWLRTEPVRLFEYRVCYEVVSENSNLVGVDSALELRHVILHGVLHLLGYSHGSEEEENIMREVEEKWLGSEIHDGLSE